jgi:ubiquinone/menaquinone biosynthesis C-methylase UbiE
MRREAISYICCPACNSGFLLSIGKDIKGEVLHGTLECRQCKKCFKITDGFPNLNFPEALDESDERQQMICDRLAPKYDRYQRRSCLSLGMWEFALMETRARRLLINKLELKKGASVLETGTGTGSNLPIIAKQIGKEGQLDGSDISSGMLKEARSKMKAKDIQAELLQANASYLPYGTATFDAVLQVGGLNTFGDKKRAIEEMFRVAKPKAKIVICDEGLTLQKQKTWMGRRILKHRRKDLYTSKPPMGFVPDKVEDLRVYWIWHDIFWVIEFRKKT